MGLQLQKHRVELDARVSPTDDLASVTVSFDGGGIGQLNRASLLILALTEIAAYLEEDYGMNPCAMRTNIEPGQWRERWPRGPNYLR